MSLASFGLTTLPAPPGGAAQGGTSENPLRLAVPLREDPYAPDGYDDARIGAFAGQYNAQTELLLVRDRQVEYNLRMVCGQQWNQWHPGLAQFVDIAQWLPDDQRWWRKLPVVNKLLRWYTVTHARLTENAPIITFLPGPDRADAQLAEVLDTLFKLDWRRAGMERVHDELMMWLIIAGESYALSSIDPTRGEWREWVGEARLPLLDAQLQPVVGPDGTPQMTAEVFPDVPFDARGNPRAGVAPNGEVVVLGPPHAERQGGIRVDVYSPLQVRGQWGPQPWHQKRWHMVQRFLTPEEVFALTGEVVEPDVKPQAAANMATLERILYGAGFYGASTALLTGSGWGDQRVRGGLCTVYHRWEAPLPFDDRLVGTWAEPMMEGKDRPGGRETVFTPLRVLYDGPRRVAWPYTSPINAFAFVRLPGRPTATTPLETLVSPQRAYNTSRAQLQEHAGLLGNPQGIVDADSGLDPATMDNRPGRMYKARLRPDVRAVEYLTPPPISTDVYRLIEYAAREIDELGQLVGTDGAPPTASASGELIKELRFDNDRFLGPTARRNVTEYARMAENWMALYPLIYTTREVIQIAGDDHVARTVTVLPELFSMSRVNVVPDVESMLPEGRGERQARAYALWREGAFGDPHSPQALDIFLSQSRFPHYSRLARPGGVDRVTAEQENGELLQGAPEVQIYQWHDHLVHLMVHEGFMKSPEFKKLDRERQSAFAFHRMQHILMLQQQMPADGGGGVSRKAAKDIPRESREVRPPGPKLPQSQQERRAPGEAAPATG